jgi:formate/nitrite transporter FocA (FNT family)
MNQISLDLMNHGWLETFVRAISAGFLMAAMVWLIPSADTAQVYVITLMTYLIAVGGFMHIVAGSMEAFMLTMNGDTTWTFVTINFVLPVLAGNIIGGTALFALLSYAQVMKEI